MKFPVVIRHRREKATIYGKSANYPFDRLCHYVAGQRRVRIFKTYGEARREAEKVVRDLAQGSQAAGLSAIQSHDTLAALEPRRGFLASKISLDRGGYAGRIELEKAA